MQPVSVCQPITNEEIEKRQSQMKPPSDDAKEQLGRVETDLYNRLEMDLFGDGKNTKNLRYM